MGKSTKLEGYRGEAYYQTTDKTNAVKVIRLSPFSGQYHCRTIQTTVEALESYGRGEGMVQEIFRGLPADEREFIMTGITPTEWLDTIEGAEL